MSETPRTDSQLLTVKDCSYVAPHPTGEYVRADFARELERENAALRADAERYHYIRRDTARKVGILWDFIESVDFFDLDAAIDSARAKEAKP